MSQMGMTIGMLLAVSQARLPTMRRLGRAVQFTLLCLLAAACATPTGADQLQPTNSDTIDPSTIPANAYYVSPSGSDDNPGTVDAPWQTLAKAATAVTPGATVVLYGGTYTDELILTVSGTAAAPITFMAYPGQVPIIDPSIQVSGWARVGTAHVWSAPFAPGAGFSSPLGADPASPMTSCADNNPLSRQAHGFVSVDRVADQAHWLGPQCVGDPSTLPSGSWTRAAGGLLYIRLADDSSPNDHSIFVANGAHAVLIWTASYVTIKDLTARLTGQAAIESWGGHEHDVVLDGLDVSLTHLEAVRTQFGNSAWTIRNGDFHDTEADGLHLETTNSLVQNNTYGPMLTSATVWGNYGIDLVGNHNRVVGNKFHGNRDGAIILEQWYCTTSSMCNDTAQHNIVESNLIYEEPNGIEASGADNNLIRNNVFYDSDNGAAFYLGGMSGVNPSYQERISTNNLFANNTLYNIRTQGVTLSADTAGIAVENNIFAGVNVAIQSNAPSIMVSSNLYDGGPAATLDVSPRTGSAQFVDAAHADFHLQPGSAAIGLGVNQAQVTTDFDGSQRPHSRGYSIGAYEFNG